MLKQALETKTKFIRGFSDKTRLQILEAIQHEEKTVSHIVSELQGNQSNISQHLACLKDCGIINRRQEGKFIYYSLRNDKVKDLLRLIDEVFHEVQTDIENCDNDYMG